MSAIPPRRSREPVVPDIVEDDSYYVERRSATSARRYQQRHTEGGPLIAQRPAIQRVDAYGRPVVRQGNREFVMVPAQEARRRFHWSMWLGIVLLVMIVGWLMLNAFGTWWTDWRNYTDYSYPRTYQTDGVVGHRDSSQHPSHFLFMNVNSQVVIVEFPGGDVTKAVVYKGATLFGSNPSYVPVTGSFADMNGDGKPDMIVSYGGNTQVWFNNGSQFAPPGR